jgi:hypothetical protein
MSKAVWGPITWRFLHTVVAKIRPESFASQRNELLTLVRKVCDVLPCPECRSHAQQTLNRANFNNIHSKDDLVTFLFEFHNIVNGQTRKPVQPRTILKQYEAADFGTVINEFASIYSATSNISNLMNDSFRRKLFLTWLRKYLIDNGKCFNA